MKAVVQNAYGSPDVLELKDVDKPAVKDNEVLVRVLATAVNAGDYFSMRGSPWLVRLTVGFPKPKNYVLGWDAAGRIEAVGKKVTMFQPGDEVFGSDSHAFAEYMSADADQFVMKPANLTFEQAAAVPSAALTALQALRDKGKLQPGQKVLINGASGGVGTFAVQIARHFGAKVTGVCSARNVDLVSSLGAENVLDYKKTDLSKVGESYDLIFDAAGKLISGLSGANFRNILSPGGNFVSVEDPRKDRAEDLGTLKDLIEEGTIKTVIDRVFPLEEMVEAHRYVESGKKHGSVVIKVR